MNQSRKLRRAYLAERRRQERHELEHECAVKRDAEAENVDPAADLGVGVLFFHDLHRALGEAACPKCPECTALRREGRIGRPATAPKADILAEWQRVLAAARKKKTLAENYEELREALAALTPEDFDAAEPHVREYLESSRRSLAEWDAAQKGTDAAD